MRKVHRYQTTLTWTGYQGIGTTDYQAYKRDHTIAVEGKPVLHGSSDAAFRGDASKYNPEDLLVSALSGCHMLWYLHLCATHGVLVIKYEDCATGTMEENADGSGQFTNVTLHPVVSVAAKTMVEKAISLHDEAHRMCFIARSVNFPLHHQPEVTVYEKTGLV
jgi:organic hydroperoxide reductase OsmC/OhrA